MSSSKNAVDPITIEVIDNAISSLVEEMGMTLIRGSYSTNINRRLQLIIANKHASKIGTVDGDVEIGPPPHEFTEVMNNLRDGCKPIEVW